MQPPAGDGGQLRPYAGQLETDDGQWVRATKDYANTRYSTLDQINTGSVGKLHEAWSHVANIDVEYMQSELNPAFANIIEVLSESTEAYDRGDKFAQYREIVRREAAKLGCAARNLSRTSPAW